MYPHQIHVSATFDLVIVRLGTNFGEIIYTMQYKVTNYQKTVQYSVIKNNTKHSLVSV